MIDLILLLGILVWPFGQILELPLTVGVNVAVLDLVAFCLTFVLVFTSKFRRLIVADRLFKPIIGFDIVALVSIIVAVVFSKVSPILPLAYWLRFVIYGSFYFAFRFSKQRWGEWLVISGVIYLLLGFVQYLFFPDMRFLYYLGFDDHLFRWVGALLDPNYAGLILVIMTLSALIGFKGREKLLSLLPLLALALTFSRASYLTLVIALILPIIRQKRLILLGLIVVLGLFVYLIPKPFGEGVNLTRVFSIQSRLRNQEAALKLFAQEPILGQGFGELKNQQGVVRQFGIPVHIGGVDNSLLFVLVSTGIVGSTVFLYFLWQVGLVSWSSPLYSTIVVSILFHSLFNNSFFYSWVLAIFWLTVAFAGGTYKSGTSKVHIGKDKVQKHIEKA